jgi:glycine cleavage system aminomethyltransferase T
MNVSASIRRSPVHASLAELNPVWGQIHNMQVPLRFNEAGSENQLKLDLSLSDMSFLPKIGVKGPESLAWLAKAQVPVPESIYSFFLLADSGLVIRTDRHEVFIEGGLNGTLVSGLEHQLRSRPSGVYLVGRQEASFLLSGAKSNDILHETCGFDFSDPPEGVVITRVAGVSCMILPLSAGEISTFRFWLDPSYGSYFWEALLEIVRGHGGDAIGVEALYTPPPVQQTH